MRIAAILLALSLTACGGGGGGGGGSSGDPVSVPPMEDPCVPVDIDYVHSSALVYIEPTDASCLTPAQIEEIYYNTITCVGITGAITAPRIEFVSFVGTGRDPSLLGQYQQLSGQIWINSDRINTLGLSRYALSHEFVHHALFFLGATEDENHGHQSTAFETCEVRL